MESGFRSQRGRSINKTTHTLSLLPSRKAAPRLLSKSDVAHLPADQNAKLPTHDVLTNQSEKAEYREPLRVTVDHFADRSTAKQIDKPRKKQKQRSLTQNHKQTTKYQLPDSSDDNTDVQIEIAKLPPVK